MFQIDLQTCSGCFKLKALMKPDFIFLRYLLEQRLTISRVEAVLPTPGIPDMSITLWLILFRRQSSTKLLMTCFSSSLPTIHSGTQSTSNLWMFHSSFSFFVLLLLLRVVEGLNAGRDLEELAMLFFSLKLLLVYIYYKSDSSKLLLYQILLNMFFGGHPGMQQEQTQPQSKKQVNTTELYELLDIPKDANTEVIKKAYRKKALKEHPDRGGDPEKFRRIKEASQILSDPEKRQLYDQYGEEGVKNGGPPGMGGNIFDFFNRGQKDNRPKKMKPKLVSVEVTLQQIFTGAVKELTITRYRVCSDCEGKGGSNPVKCGDCQGHGVAVKMVQIAPGMVTQAQVKCDKCGGKGEVMKEEDKCKACEGKRVKEVEKKIEVHVEPGVPDSHDYIFYGQADELPGVEAGDFYARVAIKKHEVFERRGADLAFIKEISLLEAVTGVTTTIKHLNGKEYLVATAPGQVLQNKDLKTLRSLGLPFYKDMTAHGNLYFQFIVSFPKANSISSDQEKVLRQAFLYSETNEGLDKKQNAVPLEDYSEELLNPRTKKNVDEDEEGEGQGGGIQCQGQ